jgi:hypothetical protein
MILKQINTIPTETQGLHSSFYKKHITAVSNTYIFMCHNTWTLLRCFFTPFPQLVLSSSGIPSTESLCQSERSYGVTTGENNRVAELLANEFLLNYP